MRKLRYYFSNKKISLFLIFTRTVCASHMLSRARANSPMSSGLSVIRMEKLGCCIVWFAHSIFSSRWLFHCFTSFLSVIKFSLVNKITLLES